MSFRDRLKRALVRTAVEPRDPPSFCGGRGWMDIARERVLEGDSERVWFYVFARHDVPDFAAALERVLDSPALRERIEECVRRAATTKPGNAEDWDNIVLDETRAIMAAIEQAVEGKP